jgi:peptidoglycan/xylan/chitin deacetylase (PgdA/CDA1 family)/GT2 family glycosyltransferase
VLASVRSLAQQVFDGSFEVIVVVDGSEDGSAAALRDMDVSFPLSVLEQPNQGAATARNRGAAAARGDILLFLDDDMEAHPRLLAEHDRSHREGADVVLGHLPLHPRSPSNILSTGVKSWADNRVRRLSSPGASLTLHDLLTGQLSLSRKTFYCVGGFDTDFTQRGSFGNEDVDFGYRLLLEGYKVIFNPNAISWQHYVVQPRQYLRQWRQVGRADVAFARKHPDQAKTIFMLNEAEKWINRYVWRPVLTVPLLAAPLMGMLRWLALVLVDRGSQSAITARLFFETRAAEYWRGVWEAGGIPRLRPLRVLVYHAIADLSRSPVLAPYGVSPDVFRRQLDTLLHAGFQFVDADEFVRFLYGHGGLPRRALLLTFDDCYEDLLDIALPILEERRIPAVAFAVTGRLGGTNDWDEAIGAPQLRLLDTNGLRKLAEKGIEIGGHSRTHRLLTRLPTKELSEEIAGSGTDLEKLGLARPRLFAYPYGECDHRVQRAAQEAGLQAAFTVHPNRVRPGQNPYQIPRIEILRGDVGWKLRWKIAIAGRLIVLWVSIYSLLRQLRRHIRGVTLFKE